MKQTLFIAATLAWALANSGYAATLAGSVDTTPPTGVKLTVDGSLDWAIWDYTTSSGAASRPPTNTKSGGPGLFSDITAVGGTSGTVRGVGSATQTYTYTDGTSPTSQSNATLGFVINSNLQTDGAGVSLSIRGNPAQAYTLDLWTAGFKATGNLTASLNNTSDVVLSGVYGADKDPILYSFTFQPDSVSDLLVIRLTHSNSTGASSHVGIQAAAVSIVPEPSSLLLLTGGLSLLGLAQRRRRV